MSEPQNSKNNSHQDDLILIANDDNNNETLAGLEDFFNETTPKLDTPNDTHHVANDEFDIEFLNQLGKQPEDKTTPATDTPNTPSTDGTSNADADELDMQFLNQLGRQTNETVGFQIDFNQLSVPSATSNDGTNPINGTPTDDTNAASTVSPNEPTQTAEHTDDGTTDNTTNTINLNKAGSDEVIALPHQANPQNSPSTEPKQSPNMTGLFKKEQKVGKFDKKASKVNQGGKVLFHDPKKLNMLILAGVVLLILIAVLLYVTLFRESTPDVAAQPSTSPNEVASVPAPTTAPTSSAQPAPTAIASSILPDVGQPNINPDEILNADIPADPALVKEEIDRLADKGKQLGEQEKIVKEQLAMMEELTIAKAEQIALLEAQIAELEKQKSAPTTTASSGDTSKPNTQQSGQ